MRHLTLACLLLVCSLLPIQAQELTPVRNTANADAPLVAVDPLHGVVTVVKSAGVFYTNLGSSDTLMRRALVLILRNGAVLGQAQILKVTSLDSIAQLTPDSEKLIVQPGDIVVVLYNPCPPRSEYADHNVSFRFQGKTYEVNLSPIRRYTHRLPACEPDMSQRDEVNFFALSALVATGLLIANP